MLEGIELLPADEPKAPLILDPSVEDDGRGELLAELRLRRARTFQRRKSFVHVYLHD